MSKIKVALRVRPLSEREVDGGYPVVLAVENNSAFVTDIRVPESPSADSRPRLRQFQFDHGFHLDHDSGVGASQEEIYQEMGPPLEASILDGYNACLLAYGQSGTGKTHTMLGSRADPGLIPRLCHRLWDTLNGDGVGESKTFRMEVSFMEIYREKVRDLLKPGGRGHLKLREHPQLGPHVEDLSRLKVTQEEGLLDLLWEGEHRRAIGTTGSNHQSSRSHAIWTIYLTREKTANSSTTITNRVHLVDLAGSEKAGFTTAKNLLAEGADINRSLVALGNVISALAEKAQYIPYRDSALTWLLKDSLGGNATTAVIITASPASSCHAQTLNSFRFATRARLVENKPRINWNASSQSVVGGVTRGSGSASASAIYSIMSAFEIKKDISKLSRIIRSAQNFASVACYWAVHSIPSKTEPSPAQVSILDRWNLFHNGGLLRGLAPRASWNRLVNALEGWNAIESEQLSLQRERAASLDTATSNSSKDCSPKSDATSQADLPPSNSPPTANSSSNTPTRLQTTGSEVFIPLSSSIKCLTWKQEEIQPAPKLPESPTKEEYCSVRLTPPTTPTSSQGSSRKHNFHLLLPVQYPVPQHLDHASRISERIHRSLSSLPVGDTARLGIVPDALLENNCPLIRQRIPTLVNCGAVGTLSGESQLFAEEKALPVPILVENEVFFGFDQEETGVFAEFTVPGPEVVPVFSGIDMEEVPETELDQVKVTSGMRVVPKHLQRRHCLTLQLPPRPSIFSKMLEAKKSVTFEDICEVEDEAGSEEDLEMDELRRKLGLGGIGCRPGSGSPPNSSLTSEHGDEDDEVEDGIFEEEAPQSFSSTNPIPSPIWSSRCSLGSDDEESEDSWDYLNGAAPKSIPILVKVIPEEREEKDFRLESITDWVKDVTNSNPVVSTVQVDLDLDPEPDLDLPPANSEDLLLELDPDHDSLSDLDVAATPDSKFRSHFAQEFTQMEKMGQQLKKLQQIATQGQRFSLVQPYLEQIFRLDESDHTAPDPKLDPQIEECSGWNVETEMNLVNKEVEALSKMLKIKSSKSGRRDSVASGSGSSHSNSNSTLPSSSTTQSQSAGSPQPPTSPPGHLGHYFHGRGRQMASVSETLTRVPDFGWTRPSFSDSGVGLGLRRDFNLGEFPRFQGPYSGRGRGEVEYGQHSQYYNQYQPSFDSSRMRFEHGPPISESYSHQPYQDKTLYQSSSGQKPPYYHDGVELERFYPGRPQGNYHYGFEHGDPSHIRHQESSQSGSTAATPSHHGFPFPQLFSTPSSSSTTPSHSHPYTNFELGISSPRPNPMASYNSDRRPSAQYSNSSINSIFQRRQEF